MDLSSELKNCAGVVARRVLCGILGLLVWTPELARAQTAIAPLEPARSMQLSQPVPMEAPEAWDYLMPVGNLLLSNIVYWAGSRYFLKNDFSYIDPSTMVRNFDQGFGWDSDEFVINQFGHPYQGAGYQAGARAVGFGFWGAIPYTLLGSLQWELFMENTRPSYNDLITTVVGGVALGEVIFRLSSALLDPSSHGVERAAREGGALVITPVYGLARLVSGEATREGPAWPTQPVSLRFGLGLNNFDSSDLQGSALNLGFDVRIVYGDFVDTGEPFAPFDWFTLRAGANYRPDDFKAADLDLNGLLARWSFGCGQKNSCVWGPSMHYDFHQTSVFSVGTSAVGLSGLGRFDLGWAGLRLYAGLDVDIVALGGFDSPYVEQATGRNYNLGSGGFARAQIVVAKPGLFQLSAFSSRYYVRTVKGTSGHEIAGISGGELEIPIEWGLGIAVGVVYYDRVGIPDHYPRVDANELAQQVQIYWRP